MYKLPISLLALLATAVPAAALTVDKGVVVINQADALAGGVTPGDPAGFPITISVPGTYRLASNLQVTAARNGFTVNAAEVTIDFAGFRMIGGGTAYHGIEANQRALTVSNGTIRAFARTGILGYGTGLVVDRMRISNNAWTGIYEAATGTPGYAQIVDSTVTENTLGGILCSTGCHVETSIVAGNGDDGIYVNGGGGNAFSNTLSYNQDYGFRVAGSAPLPSGYGNNAVFSNGVGTTSGNAFPTSANACAPQNC